MTRRKFTLMMTAAAVPAWGVRLGTARAAAAIQATL